MVYKVAIGIFYENFKWSTRKEVREIRQLSKGVIVIVSEIYPCVFMCKKFRFQILKILFLEMFYFVVYYRIRTKVPFKGRHFRKL